MIDDRAEIVNVKFDHNVRGFIRREAVARPQKAEDETTNYNK